jgi:hypothetical protein
VASPTVGELLHDADRQVRSVLWEITALNGPALLAGWPDLAAAAAEVLAAIPHPGPAAALFGRRVMVHADHLTHRVGALPPLGDPDTRFVDAADALQQAAALLHRHATPATVSTPAQYADADAARLRVAQTLHVGVHVVATALTEYRTGEPVGVDGKVIPVRSPQRPLYVRETRPVEAVLARFESDAGHYVTRHRRDAAGQHQPPIAGDVPAAVARWGLVAARTLAAPDVAARDIIGIARTEALLAAGSAAIIRAATDRGHLDPGAGLELVHRLERSAAAWLATAAGWAPYTTPKTPTPSLDCVAAADTLRRAIGEVTRDGSGWATPGQVDDRCHVPAVVTALAAAREVSADLAHTYTTLPGELAHTGRLHAPARVVLDAEMARQPVSPGSHPSDVDSPRALPVSLADVARTRNIAATPGAVAHLADLGASAAAAARNTDPTPGRIPRPPAGTDVTKTPGRAQPSTAAAAQSVAVPR